MKRTLRAIFPTEEHDPDLGFTYFGHAGRPFGAAAPAPSWHKAWWCAQLALLAYTNEQAVVDRCLAPAGLTGQLHAAGNNQCLLAHDGAGNAWLAFRGTEIVAPSHFNLPLSALVERFRASGWDWLGNLNLVPVAWRHGTGRVHQGFQDGFEALATNTTWAAEVERVSHASLWLTGHSLGGALATLAAASPLGARAAGLYTFGSPPVGDSAFGHAVRVPHLRFVNGRDAVPRVPLGAVGFEHHGQPVERPVESVSGLFAHVGVRDGVAGLVQFLSPGGDALPAGFSHHAPLLYVAQCAAHLDQPLLA